MVMVQMGRGLVTWSFEGGRVSIDGEDGMQCVVDKPASELIACISGGAP
ncbi:MAG: hypothetical protein ACK6A7_09750 [Planctomycetota bacterium]